MTSDPMAGGKSNSFRYVGTNDNGLRVGQYHRNAKLSDSEVDQMRDLKERAGWSYGEIARAYGVNKSCVAKICRYERRAQTVVSWRKVEVADTPR